ncbi:MAG TPA: hypothetical protein VK853_08900 [Ilumatobacteraceae bacterium]|nr:hypothetical protein [Ilumatobacteraceae bacterium]
MSVVARARLVLARRPWLYWSLVVALAVLIGSFVHTQITALEHTRRAWGETRPVLVATAALEPGEPIRATLLDRPLAMLPEGALAELPTRARLHQRVSAGEVLTTTDITSTAGPAARAALGTVVVGLSDPLSRNVTIGSSVRVVADGIVLADAGTVVDLAEEIVFVAVDAADGPIVAAAAQQGIATLLHLP